MSDRDLSCWVFFWLNIYESFSKSHPSIFRTCYIPCQGNWVVSANPTVWHRPTVPVQIHPEQVASLLQGHTTTHTKGHFEDNNNKYKLLLLKPKQQAFAANLGILVDLTGVQISQNLMLAVISVLQLKPDWVHENWIWGLESFQIFVFFCVKNHDWTLKADRLLYCFKDQDVAKTQSDYFNIKQISSGVGGCHQ